MSSGNGRGVGSVSFDSNNWVMHLPRVSESMCGEEGMLLHGAGNFRGHGLKSIRFARWWRPRVIHQILSE
jgi:hypothetical protein